MKILADTAKLFIRKMAGLGVMSENLFMGTTLDKRWLDEDAMISIGDYTRMIINALDITGDPALGLKIGSQINLLEYGIWGYAIISCATVRETMEVWLKYWDLCGELVDVSANIDKDDLIWDITPIFHSDDPRVTVFAMEEWLSGTNRSHQSIHGRILAIKEMHLSYPKPDHVALYKKITSKPIVFGAERNRIILSTQFLNDPVPSTNPIIREMSEKQCRVLLEKFKHKDEFIEEIQKIILTSMGNFPKAEEVSKKMNLSLRSLYRNLKERNKTYMDILDEVRTRISMEYLKNTNLTIDQISDLIGFSETTTFRQAFKKWTGVSPTQFRHKSELYPTTLLDL